MAGRGNQPLWNQLFQLSFRSKISLQAQIREMLVGAILDGHLPGGAALPSTRTLAAELGVARNTVALAYELLVQEGYLRTKSRSGHFVDPQAAIGRVALPRRDTVTAEPVAWRSRMRGSVSAQRNIVKPADWQRYPYPFIYGQIDPGLLPIAGWRECSLQAMSATEVRGWAADRIDADDPLLIEQIQSRLLARRGVFATPDEILVTVGAQHALFLLATLLVNGGTRVGVEDPGYPDARNIFGARTRNVVPLPLDGQGLALSAALDDCDYVYVTPSHQCPTNVTMPLARRAALLDWAQAHDRVLVEDDYEVELGLEGRAQPALKSLDRAGRVIYVSSLSKTLAPGIRIGFIVASAEVVREARALRRLMLRHPAANNERSTALFLAMGYHDALLRRLRQAYAERSAVVAQALRRHLPGVTFATVPGASSFWLRFDPRVDTRALAAAAARRGVLIEPGDVFFSDDTEASHHYARLGFASIAPDRIEPGLAELAAACAELVPQSLQQR
ncbi:MAG TPA: PLP-dependent aminotransferase family protein [Casimicrobiaceae bacterium]|jgi:GntR family transcriptional regulator/MocR family aminotransferase